VRVRRERYDRLFVSVPEKYKELAELIRKKQGYASISELIRDLLRERAEKIGINVESVLLGGGEA